MSNISLENFLIVNDHHEMSQQIATEGFFFDDKNLQPKSTKFSPYYDQFGTKFGNMGYPSKDFVSLVSNSWVKCPADFNKNGPRVMKELTDAIVKGTEFAKVHGKELGDLFDAKQFEKGEDLLRQFKAIFSAFISMNQQWNRGQKAFNGVPEPVKDSIKRDIMTQVNTVAECMKWAAHDFEKYKVDKYESKSTLKKIFNKNFNLEARKRDMHGSLAWEVHAFCRDWLDFLFDNIYNQ